MIEFIDKIEYC